MYRRIFLSHCSYADTGVVQAVEAASAWEESSIAHSSAHGLDVVATPEPLDLRPGQTASGAGEQCTKGLLKGLSSYDPITASSTLEPVVVHHLGRKVVVTPAAGRALEATNAPEEGDEPAAARCGDVYLKTNSMRRLLHACAPPERGSGAEAECLASGASALRQVLDRCAEALHEPGCSQPALRWELAVSWAQYLKEPPSEGPGAKRAPGSSFRASPKAKVPPMVLEGGSDEGEAALRGEMGEEAFAALAKQDVGLHRFSPAELHRRASEWWVLAAGAAASAASPVTVLCAQVLPGCLAARCLGASAAGGGARRRPNPCGLPAQPRDQHSASRGHREAQHRIRVEGHRVLGRAGHSCLLDAEASRAGRS